MVGLLKPPLARMTCSEKQSLTQEYEAATAKFAEAVKQLRQQIGTSSQSEYERLQRVSDEARLNSKAGTSGIGTTHGNSQLLELPRGQRRGELVPGDISALSKLGYTEWAVT
jgi:hypothetical protein